MILKGSSTSQKMLCGNEAQTCKLLAPLWVTLRTARGAGLGVLSRKYYDVAKVAHLGRQIGPFRGSQSMSFGGQSGHSLNPRPTKRSFERG